MQIYVVHQKVHNSKIRRSERIIGTQDGCGRSEISVIVKGAV